MKSIIHTIFIFLLLASTSSFAFKWLDLWQTKDQQGAALLQNGKANEASQVFVNKDWQAVAQYQAKHYKQAYDYFVETKTSDGQYNAGNAAAYMGQYRQAIKAYDKAIALNSNNTDAIANRDIVKKLLNEQNKQQKQNQQKNQKKQDQQNQEQQKQDQQKQEQGKQDQQNQEQQNQDQQKKEQGKQDQQNQEQQKQDQQKQDQQKQDQQNQEQQKQDQQKQQQKQQQQQQQQQKQQQQQNNHAQINNNADRETSSQSQSEEDKQLLRRLSDDPGGLLHQKFMRDYLKRHADAH